MIGRPPTPADIRFDRYVRRGSGCWVWSGARDRDGYGVFRLADGRQARAHRTAWQLSSGPIPAGMLVLHRCDNPPCVRPDHLWLGTARDNSRDRDSKGRAAWQKKRTAA